MEEGEGGREEVVLIEAWPGPFVLRAKVALNLKGVRYENAEEVLWEKKSELLLKSNPIYKKVPVLIHKQRSICESMIIVEYVDEVWPTGPAILPSDPFDRAVARFCAVYLDDKWLPNIIVIVRGQSGEEAKADATEQLVSGLLLMEEVFKKCSIGKGYFGGATIGYLDIALGSYIEWIRVTEEVGGTKILDKEKTPLLFAWAEEFCKDDAVKDVIPSTQKLLEHAMLSRPRWNSAITKN